MLPRQFQLDHQLRFTAIEGAAGTARLGASLREALATKQVSLYEADFPVRAE